MGNASWRKGEKAGLAVLTALLFLWTLAPLQGFDFWFYLATGRYILAHGIPWEVNFLGTTQALGFGKYGDQAWLGSLVFYLIYLAGGTLGLVLSRSALLAGISALTYRNCRLVGLAPWPAALWTALGLWSVRSRFLLRTYHFTDLCLAALVWLLLTHRKHDRRRLLLLGILFCLWGNLHQGVIAGWVFVFLWEAASRVPLKQGLQTMAVAIVGGLLRPHGWSFPMYLYDHFANQRAVGGVLEWVPLDARQMLEHLGLFLVLTPVLALIAYRRGEWPSRIPWPNLLVVLAFLLLALRSQRAVAELLPVAFPLLAAFLPKELKRPAWRGGMCLALLALFYVTWPVNRTTRLTDLYPQYPVRLAPVLLSHQGQTLNSYEFGGYLSFLGEPAFIHGMTAVFKEELIAEFQSILNANARGLRLLDSYQVTKVLLHYPTEVDATEILVNYLYDSPDWKLEAWDDSGLLFLRGDAREGLTAVKPWSDKRWEDPEKARRELESLVARFPSARAYLMLAELASTRHDWPEAARFSRKALEIMPTAYEGWQGLGVAAAQTGDIATMLEASKEAVRWGPDRPRAHFNRALALLNSGREIDWWTRRKIKNHLRKTLELDPNFQPARQVLDGL